MKHFFPPNSRTDLRSDAHHSQIIGGDAGGESVGGIQSKYWGGISPPGFGTPASKSCKFACDPLVPLFLLIQVVVRTELSIRYLPLFGRKSSGAAAYRYLNEKVAPLPLLAYKTAAGASCRCRYFEKINSKKNDGIQMRYLMVKFQF